MDSSRQSNYILLGGTILAILTISSLLLLSNQLFTGSNSSNEELVNVHILTTDSIADSSWGSEAYRSQLLIEEKFDVATELHSHLTTPGQIEMQIRRAGNAEVNVVIGHGREFSDIFAAHALDYPKTTFVTIHGEPTHPNQASYTFDVTNLEKYIGLAGLQKSESNIIGVLSMVGDWEGEDTMTNFVRQYDSRAEIIHETVPSRDDSQAALRQFNKLVQDGADVIYTRGNLFNRFVIEEAAEQGIYIVGFIEDQSFLQEETVLTSLLIHIPEVYEKIMQDYMTGGMESKQHLLTEEDLVYSLAPLGPMFTEEEVLFITEEMEKDPMIHVISGGN
ncbi:BMP family ABC transporter substrate-binding protein [Paenalkalicoccus suaedae]|uniref:BMP family ABC transporter substrate-binding protein n=1 Tax=Paenalkalicoccus suaedae TaxID=2592382 RepID=A0A859FH91_9BACI|nr:BMP family ABC transporter substrate-binding protein [Paenalkalicoccus suaedae]QKS72431.1 BMP family ABC transporter substrate-binding protein [Paenalkalicoccus suaedae]